MPVERDCYFPRLCRMLILFMGTFLFDAYPAILHYDSLKFFCIHFFVSLQSHYTRYTYNFQDKIHIMRISFCFYLAMLIVMKLRVSGCAITAHAPRERGLFLLKTFKKVFENVEFIFWCCIIYIVKDNLRRINTGSQNGVSIMLSSPMCLGLSFLLSVF